MMTIADQGMQTGVSDPAILTLLIITGIAGRIKAFGTPAWAFDVGQGRTARLAGDITGPQARTHCGQSSGVRGFNGRGGPFGLPDLADTSVTPDERYPTHNLRMKRTNSRSKAMKVSL